MEAPKCKICGDRHYGLCRAKTGVSPKPVAKAKGEPVAAAKELPEPTPPPRKASKPTSAAKFDKVTYQRNFMRKRRAEDKAKKAKAK